MVKTKKLINDYIFYKIVCLDNTLNLCYVGSTIDFKQRQRKHKSGCNNQNDQDYNNKIYQIIRQNGGWENFKMIEIRTKEQLTKLEAEKIEEEYRIGLSANMNAKRCYITEEQRKEYQKQYRKDNREDSKEYHKQYRKDNKQQIKDYQKQYYEENKHKKCKQNKNIILRY